MSFFFAKNMMEKNNDMKNQQKTNYYKKKWEKFYNIVMFNQEKKVK